MPIHSADRLYLWDELIVGGECEEHLPDLSTWNWNADQQITFWSRWQLSFSPDWTVISNWNVTGSKILYRATLTTPYDLTTLTNSSQVTLSDFPWSWWFWIWKCARSTDWYSFITWWNYLFWKYTVTTPFTFNWVSRTQLVTVATQSDAWWYNEGRWFHLLWWWKYICWSNWVRWQMSTPYDLTTLQTTSAVNTTFITTEKADIFSTNTGNEAYITDYWNSKIHKLVFSTPYNFQTVSVVETYNIWYRPQWVWYAKSWSNEYLFVWEWYWKIRRYVKK